MSLRENHTAVVARNETWAGTSATEPYEAGWASEAVLFLRTLEDAEVPGAGATVRVQISPDGMRWLDEGTTFALPLERDGTGCARVRHFGNWLRLAAELPAGQRVKVLATFHLK